MAGLGRADYSRMRQSAHSIVYPMIDGVTGHVPVLLRKDGTPCPQSFAFFCEPQQRRLSLSYKKKMARAIGLFYDFFIFKFESEELLNPTDNILGEFAEALLHGTINLEGNDVSGMYLSPFNSAEFAICLKTVGKFAVFCSDYFEEAEAFDIPKKYLRCIRDSLHSEVNKFRSRYSFFAHLRSDSRYTTGAFQTARTAIGMRHGTGPMVAGVRQEYQFPAKSVMSLINEGTKRFRVKSDCYWDAFEVREQLIFLLMFFCGLRESELAHLFVSDIRYNERTQRAEIVLGHPSDGILSYRSRLVKRVEYLRDEFGILPRNMISGNKYAGWKNLPLLDSAHKQTFGFWLTGDAADTFWRLHQIYINKLRPQCLNHPYYFVNLDGAYRGDPLSLKTIQKQWLVCCRRIGLSVSKDLGTTPHGARAFYSKMLEDSGATPLMIQTAMHHASPFSQKDYLKNSVGRVHKFLEEAAGKLSAGLNLKDINIKSLGVNSPIDPEGLLDW